MHSLSRLLWPTTLLIMVLLFFGCKSKPQSQTEGPKPWNRDRASAEYHLIQTELQLADSAKPYFVINQPKKSLEIRVKGTVVWNTPISGEGDEIAQLRRFISKFEEEGTLVRMVSGKYLFAATEKNPDSVLSIVSEALGVNQDLLQREIPSRFQLLWENGLVMDISTTAAGKPISPFKNTLMKVGHVLKAPFGEVRLTLHMDKDKAVTFWRVVQAGTPTLVIGG
jgi:hypothetical protein